MTNAILTRLSGPAIREYYESGFWRRETIYQIARRHAEARPNRSAVRDRFRRHSYRDLIALADRFAATLAQAGLRPGDRVAVWLPNRIETVAILLACSRNRYICCPSLHRTHTTAEIMALVDQVRAKVLIVEPGFGADGDRHPIVERAREMPSLCALMPLTPRIAEETAPSWLAVEDNAGEAAYPVCDPDSVLYLAFTSGTTGQPKGVMHSDNTLLANARAVAADWALDAQSVIYTLSPLSHNLGFGAMMTALLIGGELVLHDVAGTASIVERIRDTGATYLVGVPTHATDILRELEANPTLDLRQLKGFRISGAPAPRRVIERLLRHGVIPQSGYGMTEAGSHHYTRPTDDAELIIDSSGRVCPGYEIKVWASDDPNSEVAARTIGQIGGRGASLMLGYFDDQEATESAFNREGWFMTGDLGWVDEEGYIRITGRKKDVIIRGGHNIYPARIETLAMRHAAIELAAALPVADERLGEKVCVAFVRRKDHRMTPIELLSHLDAEGLSKFDMPEYVVELDHMPVTASGKVLKRALVDQIQSGQLTPLPVRWARHGIAAHPASRDTA